MERVQAINQLTQGQVIAIDGKQLCDSHDSRVGSNTIYMVGAWAMENQLVLGQRKADDKSNEITAIPIFKMRLPYEINQTIPIERHSM